MNEEHSHEDPMSAHMHIAAGMPMMMVRVPHPSEEEIDAWKASGGKFEDMAGEAQIGGCFCLNPAEAPAFLRLIADELEKRVQAKSN